jgi:hypothetical protein
MDCIRVFGTPLSVFWLFTFPFNINHAPFKSIAKELFLFNMIHLSQEVAVPVMIVQGVCGLTP